MPSTTRAFVLQARAKFNVCLEIGAVEPNGLHQIRSLVADLLVCDEVAFLPSEQGFDVSCDDGALCGPANLAWRAAYALGIALPSVRIHIRKGLPVQAGLGGGSSDAAAALRGIAALLEQTGASPSERDLFAAAAAVGSDVCASLVPGLKVVEGTGETVRTFDARVPRWGVTLLKPSIGVSTTDAYRLLDRDRESGSHAVESRGDAVADLCRAFERGDFGRVCSLACNDFQAVIERAYPAVARARERLMAAGAGVTLLCGSGATVAGLFPSVAAARVALGLVRPSDGEWAAVTEFANGE